MKLKMYQVDAFASELFRGNPAAVVPLERWLADAVMQSIGMENNLAETAFFIPAASGAPFDYDLRWFTPALEVDLCGHATLAAAHVLVRHLGFERDVVRFSSKSGPLTVARDGDSLVLDFPARPGKRRDVPDELTKALGARPAELFVSRDWMAVFNTEDEVRALRPDKAGVVALDAFGVIATAPGSDVDFVSRFFVPRAGVEEDPVTGSAHCTLTPYWAKRLGRERLSARQISPRGGELSCRLAGDRVHIGGRAATYLEGTIEVPDGC